MFRESLAEDFRLRRKRDFILLILPAYLLFMFGVTNFISILGLVGGIAVGLDMILLLFVYVKAKKFGERIPEYTMRIPVAVIYAMIFFFSLTAIYSLFW